jgi:hypothetical protein
MCWRWSGPRARCRFAIGLIAEHIAPSTGGVCVRLGFVDRQALGGGGWARSNPPAGTQT